MRKIKLKEIFSEEEIKELAVYGIEQDSFLREPTFQDYNDVYTADKVDVVKSLHICMYMNDTEKVPLECIQNMPVSFAGKMNKGVSEIVSGDKEENKKKN